MDQYMENHTETKQPRRRREWVKTAIIIFLAVMLVLTFFSNTIMNYSLPEVAAQYPMATAITTKIRGSGTVEAAQIYNVTLQEQREIASVNVRVGDEVEEGQVLVILDELESTELSDARIQYEQLKLEYDKMLLDAGDQNASEDHSMQQLKDEVTKAQTDLANAQTYENGKTSYLNNITSAENTYNAKNQVVEDIQTQIDLLQNQLNNIEVNDKDYVALKKKVDAAAADLAPAEERYNAAISRVDELESQEASLQAQIESAEEEEAEGLKETLKQVQSELATARDEKTAAQAAYDPLKSAYDNAERARAEKLYDLTVDLQSAISAQNEKMIYARAEADEASNAVTAAENAYRNYQDKNSGVMSVESARAALTSAQTALKSAEASAADEKEKEEYEALLAEKDMEAKKSELERAEANIKRLEEKTSAKNITSRYAGVVKEVNVAAGDTTTPDSPMIVVELTEKGYTLKSTVTKAQARLLREGVEAEVTNLWNSGVSLVLSSIDVDKNDPANSRVLTFTVKGEDVTVGQGLSFSVGDKNANYDIVVPSSAIHSDADGSFVYTVEAKSSPLGNRYIVRKKTVTVLASDDVNTAISGEVTGGDFIITTSTVPVSVGNQVRIAE